MLFGGTLPKTLLGRYSQRDKLISWLHFVMSLTLMQEQTSFSFHLQTCRSRKKRDKKCDCTLKKKGMLLPYVPSSAKRKLAEEIKSVTPEMKKRQMIQGDAMILNRLAEFSYDPKTQEIWWRYPGIRLVQQSVMVPDLSQPEGHCFPIQPLLTSTEKQICLEELNRDKANFIDVEKAFTQTQLPESPYEYEIVRILKSHDPVSIERFQAWGQLWNKIHDSKTSEIILFHGTGKADWREVVKHRLDVRASKSNKLCIWGARHASYCCSKMPMKLHKDKEDKKLQTLLAVRFQLGYQASLHQHGDKRADDKGEFYDSIYFAEDDLFQVFDNAQAHIEYVIQFIEKDKIIVI